MICDSVVTFPSGISEMTLEMLLDNSFNQNPKSLYLYFCTFSPIKDDDFSFWLNGDEIRKEVIEYYQKLAKDLGIDMQVVMDFDAELVSEEELGWEELIEPVESSTRKVHHCNSERTEAKVISELAGDEI